MNRLTRALVLLALVAFTVVAFDYLHIPVKQCDTWFTTAACFIPDFVTTTDTHHHSTTANYLYPNTPTITLAHSTYFSVGNSPSIPSQPSKR